MKITILCVGKIKEAYFRDAIAEYKKRLSAYCELIITEVADDADSDRALENEGRRILERLPEKAWVTALAIEGKKMDSPGLSDKLNELMISGHSHFVFIIGGSSGLSEEVLKKADYKLSFSDMTFPHQLMRVILLEQIYRAFKIMKHEPYHK
ncbi:MAG: 23S rRNA (pseudouridine(1915)-N(3))-methyltransferase RlmH [Lachnospiraceae bacterium]|nr:23S rRNA (pseudouridine(1915)-N(3))-methyltransferase RlmH [Lachnospiraceae bacterium]